MPTWGLWMTPQRLVAVATNDDGVLLGPPHKVRRHDDGRWGLLSCIEAAGVGTTTLVVSQAALAGEALPRLAARHGCRVLVAPDQLVPAACKLAGFPRAPPRTLALLLARMPLSAPFAERLLRLELQLPLFG